MGRTLPSPVEAWPGTVTLSEPLTFPKLIAYQHAIQAARAVQEGNSLWVEWLYAALPGLLACVERWELGGDFPAGVTAETFPATPQEDSERLVLWLMGEIGQIVRKKETVPNGSRPASSTTAKTAGRRRRK